MDNTKVVKAKFSVQQVSRFTYGEVVGMKNVHATPPTPAQLTGKKKLEETEDTKFSKSIPAATLEMQINIDSVDFGKFNPGDEVYVDFTIVTPEKK